jgi:uracil phosphoribosyltransferase
VTSLQLGQNDLRRIYPNLIVLPPNFQIRGMHTIIRDATCNRNDFVFYSDRLIRLVVEHALGRVGTRQMGVRLVTFTVVTLTTILAVIN